ncbi:YdeI/OmpD-associated family protein [Cohnella cholangitidis]
MPEDLRQALDANAQASAFFDKLAPSHKKEYMRWIVEAKREETRVSRVRKAIEKLGGGLKRPSDK